MGELDHSFFEMLLDNMSDGVFVLNRETRFILFFLRSSINVFASA